MDGGRNPNTETALNHSLYVPYAGQRVGIGSILISTGVESRKEQVFGPSNVPYVLEAKHIFAMNTMVVGLTGLGSG